jgi:hypothetical protein
MKIKSVTNLLNRCNYIDIKCSYYELDLMKRALSNYDDDYLRKAAFNNLVEAANSIEHVYVNDENIEI